MQSQGLRWARALLQTKTLAVFFPSALPLGQRAILALPAYLSQTHACLGYQPAPKKVFFFSQTSECLTVETFLSNRLYFSDWKQRRVPPHTHTDFSRTSLFSGQSGLSSKQANRWLYYIKKKKVQWQLPVHSVLFIHACSLANLKKRTLKKKAKGRLGYSSVGRVFVEHAQSHGFEPHKPGMAVHTCNSVTQEAVASGWEVLKTSWATILKR